MCSSASSKLCSIEAFISWSSFITAHTREWSCQYQIRLLKEKGNIPRVQCLCPFDYCSINIFFFVKLIFQSVSPYQCQREALWGPLNVIAFLSAQRRRFTSSPGAVVSSPNLVIFIYMMRNVVVSSTF